MSSDWLQHAIKREGRVRRYLRLRYGNKAFTKDGKVKVEYIKIAIQELKDRTPSKRPKGLLQALYLALRLKRMAKKKKEGKR